MKILYYTALMLFMTTIVFAQESILSDNSLVYNNTISKTAIPQLHDVENKCVHPLSPVGLLLTGGGVGMILYPIATNLLLKEVTNYTVMVAGLATTTLGVSFMVIGKNICERKEREEYLEESDLVRYRRAAELQLATSGNTIGIKLVF